MKKNFILFVVAMVATLSVWAQVPQTLTYQAVVRDANGRLICNSNVGVQLSIVQGTEDGTAVYTDRQTVHTNANGLFTMLIGSEENSLGGINWAAGPYYLKSEIDPTGGNNYTLETVQQLFSVPYALRAHTVDSIIGGVNYNETDPVFTAWDKDYNDLINRPTIPTAVSELANDAGYLTFFTESQILSISNDTIFLTGGSFVKLPAGFSGDYNDLTNKPTIPTVPTDVSAFNNDAGYLTSFTEVQSLGDVTTIGNAANSQLKAVSDPTDALDAVNLQTLNAVIADWQHRLDSITHKYDSIIADCIDTIHLLMGGFDADGASRALFSVSETKKVRFSKGNLQFTTTGTHATADGSIATGTWRFAEHQYDYIGEGNTNASSTYTGWIDLFCWGTSGWNSGANAYQPWSSGTNNFTNYHPGGNYENDLTEEYANADWGVYNAISNGGNQANTWRTLKKDEWEYLLYTRSTSMLNGTSDWRFAHATVNGTFGLIIFPDNYVNPNDILIPVGINQNIPATENINNYTATEWQKLESYGCCFFPAGGYISANGTSLRMGEGGYYWTTTHTNEESAYGLHFWRNHDNTGVSSNGGRASRRCTRLVKDSE